MRRTAGKPYLEKLSRPSGLGFSLVADAANPALKRWATLIHAYGLERATRSSLIFNQLRPDQMHFCFVEGEIDG